MVIPMSDASDRADCIAAARRGTLARDDQRLQAIQRRAGRGVREDQAAMEEITNAGGAHGGSVNRVI